MYCTVIIVFHAISVCKDFQSKSLIFLLTFISTPKQDFKILNISMTYAFLILKKLVKKRAKIFKE